MLYSRATFLNRYCYESEPARAKLLSTRDWQSEKYHALLDSNPKPQDRRRPCACYSILIAKRVLNLLLLGCIRTENSNLMIFERYWGLNQWPLDDSKMGGSERVANPECVPGLARQHGYLTSMVETGSNKLSKLGTKREFPAITWRRHKLHKLYIKDDSY